jgi:hypothetical protein
MLAIRDGWRAQVSAQTTRLCDGGVAKGEPFTVCQRGGDPENPPLRAPAHERRAIRQPLDIARAHLVKLRPPMQVEPARSDRRPAAASAATARNPGS